MTPLKKLVKLHSVYTNHQVLWGRLIQHTHTNIRHLPSTLTAPSQLIRWWTAQSSSPCQEEPIQASTSWNDPRCAAPIRCDQCVYIYIYVLICMYIHIHMISFVYIYTHIIQIQSKFHRIANPQLAASEQRPHHSTSPLVGRSTYLDPMQPDTTHQATTSHEEQKHQQSES